MDKFVESKKTVSLFDSFGSDKWKEMWKAAKEYSIEENINSDSDKQMCILCQQKLSEDAFKRMKEFENIYQSNVSQRFEEALRKFQMERKKLEKLIDEKLNLTVIKLNLDAKGVSDEAKQEKDKLLFLHTD